MEFPKKLSRNGKQQENNMSRLMLSDQVKTIIVEAILNGELKAGERVAEKVLSEKLGVSQSPVRDAVRELCLMGFLQSEPYKGASVRSFTPKELQEVYLVRASLESLGARLAAARLTEQDTQTLREILDAMIGAAQAGDTKKMTRLDNTFHEAIMAMSGNSLLQQLWKTLQFGLWTMVTVAMSQHDLEYLARRHEEIFEAVTSGDPYKAMIAMQHHIEVLGIEFDRAAERSESGDNQEKEVMTTVTEEKEL